jgi:hypothetical protein
MQHQQRPVDRDQVLPMLHTLMMELDAWYSKQQAEVGQAYHELNERIDQLRRQAASNASSGGAGAAPRGAAARQAPSSAWGVTAVPNPNAQPFVPSTPPRVASNSRHSTNDERGDGEWNGTQGGQREDAIGTSSTFGSRYADLSTPTGSPQAAEKQSLEAFFSKMTAASQAPAFNINLDSLYEQLAGLDDSPQQGAGGFSVQASSSSAQNSKRPAAAASRLAVPVSSLTSLQNQHQTTSVQLAPGGRSVRPQVILIPGGEPDDPRKFDIDSSAKCQLLVEFKRNRVLQYESNGFVSPGEYVVVGGDRGEDIGLVIYTWCETRSNSVKGIGLRGSSLNRSIGVGNGTVLRVARGQEVQLLHGPQAELERRAVEVCMQQVLEHGLPMVIVDAEYQFDKKKLTFFYEAQQRMDFRELVRDLFKTFRARIWMENVEV